MIMSAVLAVALNAVPVKHQPHTITVSGQDISRLVRDVRQTVDRRGTTHLTGHDQRDRLFDLTIDKAGHVEGSVGSWDVAFQATDAG
jgi:hypothetical protein